MYNIIIKYDIKLGGNLMFFKSVMGARKKHDEYKRHRIMGMASELVDLYTKVIEDRDAVEEARCNPVFCNVFVTPADIATANRAIVDAKKKLEASESLLRLNERLARRISPNQFSWL